MKQNSTMSAETATKAMEYIINLASRKQLRRICMVALRHLVAQCQPAALAVAISEMSDQLMEREA